MARSRRAAQISTHIVAAGEEQVHPWPARYRTLATAALVAFSVGQLACATGPTSDAAAQEARALDEARFAATAAPEVAATPGTAAPAQAPDVVARMLARAPGTSRKVRRARQLLIQEISALERLYQSTDKADPNQPQLLLRLGHTYLELWATAQAPGESSNPKSQALANAAISKTSSYYQRLQTWFPQSGEGQQAQYGLAFCYEISGQTIQSLQAYAETIKGAAPSELKGFSYLAIGDHFLAQVAANPGMSAAAESTYVRAAEAIPPNEPARCLALDGAARAQASQGKDSSQASAELGQCLATHSAALSQAGVSLQAPTQLSAGAPMTVPASVTTLSIAGGEPAPGSSSSTLGAGTAPPAQDYSNKGETLLGGRCTVTAECKGRLICTGGSCEFPQQ